MVTQGGMRGTSIPDTPEGSLNGLGQWVPNSEPQMNHANGWAGTSQNQFAVHQTFRPIQHCVPGPPQQQGLISYSYPPQAFLNLGYQVLQPRADDVVTYQSNGAWQQQQQILPQGVGPGWMGWRAAGLGSGTNWSQGCYLPAPLVGTQFGGVPGQPVVAIDATSIPAAVTGDGIPGVTVAVQEPACQSPVNQSSDVYGRKATGASSVPPISLPVISIMEDHLDERIPGLSDSSDPVLEELEEEKSLYEDSGHPSKVADPWEANDTEENNVILACKSTENVRISENSKGMRHEVKDAEPNLETCSRLTSHRSEGECQISVPEQSTATLWLGETMGSPGLCNDTTGRSSTPGLCSDAMDLRGNKACAVRSNALPDCLGTFKDEGKSPWSAMTECGVLESKAETKTYLQSSPAERGHSLMTTESMRCRNRGIQAMLIGDQGVDIDGPVVAKNHDATTNTDKSWTPPNTGQENAHIYQNNSILSEPEPSRDDRCLPSSSDTTASFTVAMKDDAEIMTAGADATRTLVHGADLAPVLVSVQVQTDTPPPSSGTAKSLSKFDSRESQMGASRTHTVKSSLQPPYVLENAPTSCRSGIGFHLRQDKLSERRPNSPSGSRGDESSTPRAARFSADTQVALAPKNTVPKERGGSGPSYLARFSHGFERDNVKMELTSHYPKASNASSGLRPVKQTKVNTGRELCVPQIRGPHGREMNQKKDVRVVRRKPTSMSQQTQVEIPADIQVVRKAPDSMGNMTGKSLANGFDNRSSHPNRVNQTQSGVKPSSCDVHKNMRESPKKSRVDAARTQYTGSCRPSMGSDSAKTDVKNLREKAPRGTKRPNVNLDASTVPKRFRSNDKVNGSRVENVVKDSRCNAPGGGKKFVGLFASLKAPKRPKSSVQGQRGQTVKSSLQSGVSVKADGRSERLNGLSSPVCQAEQKKSPYSMISQQVTTPKSKGKSHKPIWESKQPSKLLDEGLTNPIHEDYSRAMQHPAEQAPLSLCECFTCSELEVHFRVVTDEMGENLIRQKGSVRGRLGEETCVVCKHQCLKYNPRVKNSRIAEEPWVQCDGCQGWVHQICSLFNSRLNSTGVVYTCPSCQLNRLRNGAKPTAAPRSKSMSAKNLPKSSLSEFLESRLQTSIAKEWKARCKLHGEEAPRVNQLTVREVFSKDRVCKAGKQFRSAFNGKRDMKFPYRQRVIMLFQKIDGVDVMIFCMYTQEYGPEAPEPNRGWIYLAYVDSIKYFQPNQLAGHSDVPLRTLVYHELLLGYMEFAQDYGFHSMFIWACPPGGKDNDYIMNCHPPSQKFPTEVRLRRWYLDLLEQAKKEGLITEHTNMSEVLQKKEGAFASALQIPYFDGDYWPEATEKLLREIKSKSKARISAAAKGHFGSNQGCWDEADQDLMSMLRASQSVSAWQNFLLARFKLRCSTCKEFVGGGPSWVYCPSESSSPPQRRSSHGYAPRHEGRFVICPACHKYEVRCNGSHASKLPGLMTIHDFVEEFYKPAALRPIPGDREIPCTFLETRDLFLRVCQWNHYEFDSLRKAKHSSLMVLYHLMNPSVPALPATCKVCRENLEGEPSWKCPECLEYLICDGCYSSGLRHVHPLELVSASAGSLNTRPQKIPHIATAERKVKKAGYRTDD